MFNKLKLKNLFFLHKSRYIIKKFKGGIISYVIFKRNILEKYLYNFNGICISSRNRGIGSSLIIRNVISFYPLEYLFKRYSPLVTFFLKKNSLNNKRKAKLYFLRHKAVPFSFYKFNYIKKNKFLY
jgi:ribosomal protein L19